MNPFFGRQEELEKLQRLLKKNTASMTVIKGRRRVGKSRLAEEFGKSLENLYLYGIKYFLCWIKDVLPSKPNVINLSNIWLSAAFRVVARLSKVEPQHRLDISISQIFRQVILYTTPFTSFSARLRLDFRKSSYDVQTLYLA